jgi:hypothetical protein
MSIQKPRRLFLLFAFSALQPLLVEGQSQSSTDDDAKLEALVFVQNKFLRAVSPLDVSGVSADVLAARENREIRAFNWKTECGPEKSSEKDRAICALRGSRAYAEVKSLKSQDQMRKTATVIFYRFSDLVGEEHKIQSVETDIELVKESGRWKAVRSTRMRTS